MERLRERVAGELDLAVGVEPTESAVAEALEGVRVLFTSSRLPVTASVLSAAADLEVVAKVGTGLDTVDLEAAAREGIAVTYTPGLNARSVAEHALALLLAANRNVVLGRDTLRAGGWRDSMPTSRPVTGTTVGVVGFGNVGRRVAGLLGGFNCELLAHDPYVHEIDADVTGANLVELGELLDRSDAVVVTAEHTSETRGMIDADALARLKPEATLVNVARGPIVDTEALVDALRREELAAAGLDVFETEPLPASSPLHEFENVVVTPHIAASSVRARRNIIDTLAANALDLLAGETVPERFLAVPPAE